MFLKQREWTDGKIINIFRKLQKLFTSFNKYPYTKFCKFLCIFLLGGHVNIAFLADTSANALTTPQLLADITV